jgi:hypothetical protein
MVEQLFTAKGQGKGQRQGKDGTIVHCEEGETRKKTNRRNGEGEKRRAVVRVTQSAER